jgi:hypothetical protein
MLLGFLAFGGLWFWLVTAAFVIAMLAFIEYEKPIVATCNVVLFALVMMAFSDISPSMEWVKSNLITIAEWIGLYFVIGIVWAVVKWAFFLMNQRDIYEARRVAFLKEKEADRRRDWSYKAKPGEEEPAAFAIPIVIDDTTRPAFIKSLGGKFPPMPQDNKSRILLWMGYWPFSATWTLINDPLKRAWRFAYHRILGLLEGMSRAMFSKYDEDLVAK